MGSELGFSVGGVIIGFAIGFCSASYYWTKRIQEIRSSYNAPKKKQEVSK